MSAAGEARGASRTALGAAALRAIHEHLDGTPKILDDPISARLLDPRTLEAIRAGGEQVRTAELAALRLHVVLRSRWAEARLRRAVERGVRQLVILGAGLDTFAYRQPDWARSLRIFEVDHPASQADKRERLGAADIEPPANLTYAAIDFERVSLRVGLPAGGVDFSAPTFFSCLGVMIYLAPDAIDAIFALAAGFPQGSEIAFTFGGGRSPAAAARAADLGEPWRTVLDPETLSPKLLAMGFGPIAFPSAEEMRDYLRPPRSDGLTASARPSVGAAVVQRQGRAST